MPNYAFFDIDQTIYPDYSMSGFYLYLVTQGLGGEWTILKDKEIGDLYTSGKISYGEAGLRVSQLLAEVIKGKTVSEIAKLATQFIKIKGLKKFTPSLFALLKKHNYQIILVSGSLDAIANTVRVYSKADTCLSSTSEAINDIYTGRLLHQLDDDEKRKLIVSKIDMSSVTNILAFGDSTGDIPMLSLANHAFVIDPHQPEMKDLVMTHENWHPVNEDNILDQVKSVIENSY